jgi:hypothetical protein
MCCSQGPLEQSSVHLRTATDDECLRSKASIADTQAMCVHDVLRLWHLSYYTAVWCVDLQCAITLSCVLQNGFDVAINITASPESGVVGDAFNYIVNM